jgi:hypothetical protein
MPDGYGNDLPSWAINPPSSPQGYDEEVRWMLARHLRRDHGHTLSFIARTVGLPYEQVRERFKGGE